MDTDRDRKNTDGAEAESASVAGLKLERTMTRWAANGGQHMF